MGEWHPAKHAYMVYTDENGVMEGDPTKPTIPSIYKIPAGQVGAFQRRYNIAGAKWVPIYALHEWDDSIILKKMEEEDVNPESE